MMAYLAAAGLAVGLALDTAAVSAARAFAGRRSMSLPWLFGAFHAAMATLGWFVGHHASALLRASDHWIAAALLGYIGARMVFSPLRGGAVASTSHGETLLLAVATSIDAAAAGLAIDLLGVAPAVTIGLIGAICVAMSSLAMAFGRWIGARVGRDLDRAGGVLLWIVAIRTLVVHLR
jgi:putative Mn2+ efflux pump MntP